MERLTVRQKGTGKGIFKNYIAAEHGGDRLADYEETGLTPEEIRLFISEMREVCQICGCDHDPETGEKVNGCQYTDCATHKWRAKWWKQE